MARPPKVDLTALAQLVGKHSVPEMAHLLKVDERTVYRALKKLQAVIPREVLRQPAQVDRAAGAVLDAQVEWMRLHGEATRALDAIKLQAGQGNEEQPADTDWGLVLKAIRVCQQSLDQFLKMAELAHDWRAQQDFQQEVLDVIGECAGTDVRHKIITRLAEKRSLRFALSTA